MENNLERVQKATDSTGEIKDVESDVGKTNKQKNK